MKEDRFLLAILAGIGLLVLAALGLFFMRQQGQDYGPEDSPEGVLRNYIFALENEDYARAYSYLYEAANKPDFDQFQRAFLNQRLDTANAAVQIGEARRNNGEAIVPLVIIHPGSGPFSEGYRETVNGQLRQNAEGKWQISSLPYPLWEWNWYTPATSEPAKPLP